jgi:hypothetical protein
MANKEARRAGTRSGASDSGPTQDSPEVTSNANSPQHSPLPATIATFAKNRRETVRVTLSRFEEIDLIDIRSFAGDDFDIATKKGISLRVALLPRLIEGLQAAETEARKRGLIGGGQ